MSVDQKLLLNALKNHYKNYLIILDNISRRHFYTDDLKSRSAAEQECTGSEFFDSSNPRVIEHIVEMLLTHLKKETLCKLDNKL